MPWRRQLPPFVCDGGRDESDHGRVQSGRAGEAWLSFDEDFLEPPRAREVFEALASEVPWKHEAIRIAGREVMQPRLTAWYGDPGASYTYSGLTVHPLPWTPLVAELRALVQTAAGPDQRAFNSVLLNYYRDGDDSMGFHSDDERELGENPLIASLSLGATRRFVLRPKDKHSPTRVELDLGAGSLLVMGGSTQHHWKHAVPKARNVQGARINLTFRTVRS